MSQLLAIETFGTLKAHGSGGSRISAPRRLALLALLSAAGERGMSRDKLLLYLWPESPAEKAKHALEQLIYGVRRDMGDTVLSKGNPLRLELSLVRCDLIEFAAALARSDFATAVRVYAGPFLDGFFLNDSTEFDGWALTERARLAKAYGLALEHVARDCAAADDHRGALEHWHRYGALEPFDSRVALEYMRALAATGNPAGALQHAERHGALLRSELGASLPASIASFVEHLRRTSRRDQGSEAAFREEPEQPHDASVRLDSSGRLQRPSVRRRLRLGAYAIVGALTLATGVVMLRSGGSAGSDPDVVFVAPFRVTSPDTSLRYLREAGVDLLGALLRGDGLPRAVDTRLVLARWDQATSAADGTLDLDQAFEVARRCGAVLLLLGDVVVANGQVTARGQLYRVKSKRVIVDRVMSGGEDDAVQLLHRLGAAVIAQLMGDGEERVGTLSDSIDAVRAYLQGVRAFRAGDRRNAERHFDRALQIDSTFAVAALWNAMFDHQGAEGIETRAQIAWRLRHRLAPADRALLLGHFAIGPNYPGTSDMVSLLGAAEEAARLNPDRSEAWTRFGTYMLVHGPQAFGDAVPRAARALDSAIALDSAFGPAIGWRLETAIAAVDTPAIHRFTRLSAAVNSKDEYLVDEWIAAAVTGDARALSDASARVVRDSTDAMITRLALEAPLHIVPLDVIDRLILERFAGRQRRPILHPWHNERILESRFEIAALRGRTSEAIRLVDSVQAWIIMPLAFAEPGYDRIADSIAAAATPKESGNDGTTVCNSTVWRTIRGDTADTRRMMQRIRELGETAPVAAYPMVGRFHVCPLFLGALLERGNAGAKAVMLDSLAALLNSGVGLQYPGNVATLYVARWLEEQGKYAAALQMIRRRPYIHNPAFYLALPAHLRQEGRLAALAGDTAGAIRAYRQFLTLRDQPDPGIRLMEVQQARAALDSLLGSRSKQRTARAR